MADLMKDMEKKAAELVARKKELQKEIEQIDAFFAKCAEMGSGSGVIIAPPGPAAAKPGRKVGRPAKISAEKATEGKRQRFAVSGKEAVLSWVKGAGKQGIRTSEIVKKWEKDGRKGAANSMLNQLLHAKVIKRENIKGERGSLYRVK